MAIFRFFKMAAVRHLGFVKASMRPPTKSNWWSLMVCKIWLHSAAWFWRYASFNVKRVWPENAYSRLFWGVFGVKMGEIKSISNFISLIMQYRGNDIGRIKQHKNRFYGLGPGLEQNFGSPKKERKGKVQTTREWYFTHVPLWGSLLFLACGVMSPT